MAQDPWAWASQPSAAPLSNTIQVQQTPEMQPGRPAADPMGNMLGGMATTGAVNAIPNAYEAGKTAYIGAATPSAPLAAGAVPMAEATTLTGAPAAAATMAGAEAATTAGLAATEAATAGALGAGTAAAGGGAMAGMGAAAPAAMAALGPAALIPLGLFAAHQATKGK